MEITKQQLVEAFELWADGIANELSPEAFHESLQTNNAEEAADYLWDLLEEIQQDNTTPPNH